MSATALETPGRVCFDALRLEQVFSRCFSATENTCLIGGADEPLYLPADTEQPAARLFYREDFFASALHESAHWCIAGKQRRRQRDFGYWYTPEGRGAADQGAFLQVEARPQALEWCFSLACAYDFRVSLDNHEGQQDASQAAGFVDRVVEEARRFQREGLPQRADQFFRALALEFDTGVQLADLAFDAGQCRW